MLGDNLELLLIGDEAQDDEWVDGAVGVEAYICGVCHAVFLGADTDIAPSSMPRLA